MPRFLPLSGAAVLVLLMLPWEAAAQTATFVGSVRTQTQQPVRGALVTIEGMDVSTVTNDAGLYRLVVPEAQVSGQQATMLVTSIGYRRTSAAVTVVAGSHRQDFTMAEEAIALDAVQVTGTAGRQERRAQTAQVATIDAAAVTQIAPVTTVANLLQARSPGVYLRQESGTAGTSQTIRIRGRSSVNLSSEPLVFIDGVRADSRDRQIYGVGGQAGTRLNDLRLDEIESIEVLKGPAAATLYGADASAGVIQIITKRGRARGGFTQSITAEYGMSEPNFTPPANWGACSASLVANPDRILCHGQPVGTIVSDNPLLRENSFRDGRIRNLTWNLRGGGERYSVFLSAGRDAEDGTLPNNAYARATARTNFDFIVNEQLRLDFGVGLLNTRTQLPHNDNNIYGYLGGGFLGSPLTRGNTANNGWYAGNRQTEAISAIETIDRSVRFQPRASVHYTPTGWFTNRLMIGGDLTRTEARRFWPRNDQGWWDSSDLNRGQSGQARENVDRVTVDYLGSVTVNPSDIVRADVSFGMQAITRNTDLTFATGTGLVTNVVRSVSSAAQQTGGQSSSAERSVGIFGQTQFSIWERLYLQAAGRLDQHSAFGSAADPFFSPRIGASYVISDELFFQNSLGRMVPTLRLRGAYGTTGRSPGSGARATMNPTPFAISPTVSEIGVTFQNVGNPDLRPERGKELELGFDAGFFDDRLSAEVNWFRKTTSDLILARPLAPSLGFSQNPLANIGGVLNRGWEFSLLGRILTGENVSWEQRVSFNTLHNEVTSLGGVEPIGTTTRVAEGYPIYGYWTHTIRGYDFENNRAIVSDTMEFIGNPLTLPGWEANFSTTITLLRNFTIYAQMDARGDVYVFNSTDQFRERQNGTGERWVRRAELLTPEQRLERFGPWVTESGEEVGRANANISYIEPADFVKLREVSLSYRIPSSFAQRFLRAQGASIMVSARNLRTWTDYTGFDPETDQFLTVPQDRRYLTRLNVQF